MSSLVGDEGQGNERDGIAESAYDLAYPEEREVRRAKVSLPARRRRRLEPNEGDEETTQRDEEVAEAEDSVQEADWNQVHWNDVREKLKSRFRT